MTRIIGPPRSSRRHRTILICLAAALSVGVFYIATAQGVAPGTDPYNAGLFQLDGNTVPGTCANPFPAADSAGGDDWAALYNNRADSTPCGADAFVFVADGIGASGDNTYWSGGGSKDAYDPALGPWLWAPNDVSPDKNDINNAFAAIYHLGTGASAKSFLYFGSDRFTTNGDAQQGFQFLQANTCLQGGGTPPISAGGTAACPNSTPNPPNTTCSPAFTGSNVGYFVDPGTGCPIHHMNGDLLVLVNFNNGGTLGLAGVFEWSGATASGGGSYSQVIFGDGANCASILPGKNFCSIANTAALSTEPIWPYTKKGDKGAQSTYDASAFIEGTINLANIPGAGTCFPSFLAETRSSAGPSSGLSLQAQLKDIAFGKFQQCGVSIQITPSATNEVGQKHTFTVHADKLVGATPTALDNGNVDVTLTGSNGITAADITLDTAASTCDDGQPDGDNLDASGNCLLVFTSSKAGKVTGHATVNATFGGGTFSASTDGQAPNSGDAVKTFVDANIAITGTGTNEVGVKHTFTVTVKKNVGDGNGYVAADDGHVDVALTGSNGIGAGDIVIDTAASTCDSSDTGDNLSAAGTCLIVFSSAKAGKISGDATVTIPKAVFGTANDVVRDTIGSTATIGAGIGGDETDAVKTYVDANIAITGTGTNEVGVKHTFTVTVKKNTGNGAGYVAADDGHVDVTLTGSNGIAAGDIVIDTAASSCDDANDNLTNAGTCLIVFSSATAGKISGDATVTIPKAVFGTAADVVRDTDSGTATIGAGTGGDETDAVKTYVDAFITIGPDGVNNVGEKHTFTVAVKQNLGDGNGYVAADNGHVDVTLTTTLGAAVADIDTAASSCDDSDDNLDAAGKCTIVFTSSTPGTIKGNATVTIPKAVFGTAADVVRTTDGTGQNSGPATKVFRAGSISWLKVDNENNPQGGATFQLCQTHVLVGSTFVALSPAACKDVVDNGDASATAYKDDDPADGKFSVGGLALGKYTVQETVPPPGWVADPDTVPVTLDADHPNVDISDTPFVNTRPILKITGFGYTNAPIGTPVHGVTKGTLVYTVKLKNYGTAPAVLTNSSLEVTAPGTTTLSCGAVTPDPDSTADPDDINGTIGAGDPEVTYTQTCTYDGADGDQVSADLVVQTDTGGTIRDASGSPANITFTIQAD